MADNKKVRASCTSGGGFKKKPPPPTTGGRAEARSPPLPILGRVGGQKAARAPQSTQKGTGHYVQKNVWLQSQKQRPRDKRVRAEDLKSLVVLGDEASHKGERNASSTKKQKENNGTPTLRCPQEKCACVLNPWSPEVLRRKSPTKTPGQHGIETSLESGTK